MLFLFIYYAMIITEGLAFDDDFNLEDALVDTPTKPPAPKPKPAGGPSGGSKGGGSISDKDLEDILGDGYSPDRKKGIASAIGMALVGVVTSYISYQKKKLCFSIQVPDDRSYFTGCGPGLTPASPTEVSYQGCNSASFEDEVFEKQNPSAGVRFLLW
ncbi:CD99 antigen-like protein 2 [Acipenser ruthenus]|uniref:CD99 antigen-like protein 2 n=1 Tax=Acipenser ruthenus TaxID=7906 RepID=A0A662YMJ4_ACIRT|nr:CD99 antigen-like protein 2 [Acipenser ruthenus]